MGTWRRSISYCRVLLLDEIVRIVRGLITNNPKKDVLRRVLLMKLLSLGDVMTSCLGSHGVAGSHGEIAEDIRLTGESQNRPQGRRSIRVCHLRPCFLRTFCNDITVVETKIIHDNQRKKKTTIIVENRKHSLLHIKFTAGVIQPDCCPRGRRARHRASHSHTLAEFDMKNTSNKTSKTNRRYFMSQVTLIREWVSTYRNT